jgi:hypothetical protein
MAKQEKSGRVFWTWPFSIFDWQRGPQPQILFGALSAQIFCLFSYSSLLFITTCIAFYATAAGL